MNKIILLLCVMSSLVAQAKSDDILGLWKTQPSKKGFSHVMVEKKGDKYFGTIVFLSKPKYGEEEGPELVGHNKIDKNNPDKVKRTQPIVGLQILKDFKYDDDNAWDDGKIYDPNNGKTYKCVIKNKVKNQLYVRGYVGISIFGRTTTWTRVKPGKLESQK